GVVNIVDDRVPQATDTYGEWRLAHDSIADDKLISASGTSGIGNIGTNSVGLHLDGFWREADNYKIPSAAQVESHAEHAQEGHVHSNRLNNSWSEGKGFNI